MHFSFVKAVQFSVLVKAGDRLREFNVRKLKTLLNEDVFDVNVCNERGDRIFFEMKKVDNDWEFTPTGIPSWIEQNKNKIIQAVEDELSNWG